MEPITITLCLLVFAIIMFVWEKVPLAVTSMVVCVALVLTGVLDLKQAFAGFIDSNVILFVAMFIVGGDGKQSRWRDHPLRQNGEAADLHHYGGGWRNVRFSLQYRYGSRFDPGRYRCSRQIGIHPFASADAAGVCCRAWRQPVADWRPR
mgnify:CR=1 FL=1